jgi:hypothetical protein
MVSTFIGDNSCRIARHCRAGDKLRLTALLALSASVWEPPPLADANIICAAMSAVSIENIRNFAI